MSIKLLKQEEGAIRKISDSYSILNLLTAQDSSKMSIAISNAKNHDETTKTSSDRAYFILEGSITVDEKLIGKPGDIIFIPANIEYKFKGSFRSILINSPPFKKENEQISKLK